MVRVGVSCARHAALSVVFALTAASVGATRLPASSEPSPLESAALKLRVGQLRLEAPPPDVPAPAILLKFDVVNASEHRMTDLVLRIVVFERSRDVTGRVRPRAALGPFTIRGQQIIEPGYTFEFEMLLRNLAADCDCHALVTVLSARALPATDV